MIGSGADGLGELHPAAAELTNGVDLLIRDARYTAHELACRASRGHACADCRITLGHHCGVARLLLSHHDPSRTDDQATAIRAALVGQVAVAGTIISP